MVVADNHSNLRHREVFGLDATSPLHNELTPLVTL
jgi:hypothetical protein